MKGYKIIRIARYKKKGVESIIAIPIEEFQKLVENDPDLNWHEDVSAFYKEVQEERGEEGLYKACAVYKYIGENQDPNFTITHMGFTGDLIARVHKNLEESMIKVKEIAEKLNAQLY